jgi:predicted homoserine dehydrogenase-like protein
VRTLARAPGASRRGFYSLAYGDQPAIICEQVDWARACGFDVVCAGRGVKYLPAYHRSTPETVWDIYYGELDAAAAAAGGLNAKMFNSFIDGTKPAIESTAVANACALHPQATGLKFPPCGADDLARVCRPVSDGGCLDHRGTVEVVSSLERDGRPVFRDMRWGVFVTFAAPDDYVARCFAEYGLKTDDSGRTAALYREVHLIGLELGVSVANVALRGEPTGRPVGWYGDAVAVAKRDMGGGHTLDGEGGTTVWGRLMPAADSHAMGALPIGLAQGVKLVRPVREDAVLTWGDVAIDETDAAVRMRREMESVFAVESPKAAE